MSLGVDQMIVGGEGGCGFFSPVQTLFFAPNQKQTFFRLSKGTRNSV